ncbi:hypothetical protein EDB84DRAFT_1549203 [Lactarius hengduanensis]|nr:hypothetical protein EDB84DRAFT_1549203 [Lactarius hengduanensis]
MIARVLALFGMRSQSGAVLSRFPYHFPAFVLTGTSSSLGPPSLSCRRYGHRMSITVLVANAVVLSKVSHISQPHPVRRDSPQNRGKCEYVFPSRRDPTKAVIIGHVVTRSSRFRSTLLDTRGEPVMAKCLVKCSMIGEYRKNGIA